MKEKTIIFDSLTLHYTIDGESWALLLPKSETRVDNLQQLTIITQENDYFVPLVIEEQEDFYHFTFQMDANMKRWKEVERLPRNEKLRALYNMAKLFNLVKTRTSFFIHPENVVFDDNLLPKLIFRGIKNYVPPFEMSDEDLLKQFKCVILSLFHTKYSFNDLYNGSLEKADETEFQRTILKIDNLEELTTFLKTSYQKEQAKMEQAMIQVPKKRFNLFKYLSISTLVLSILFLVPLLYFVFIKMPYQNNLLSAHREFIASDYANVISALQDENIDKLPNQAKYILAYSFIKVENLSDQEKEVIMKNISLQSDPDYLAYWIQNGLGDFDASIDLAKYLDDPQLIMYGLIKKIEQVKNNPKLSGSERDEQVTELRNELEKYKEEYELDTDEETDDMDEIESGKDGKDNDQDEEKASKEKRK